MNINLYFIRHAFSQHNQLMMEENEEAFNIFDPQIVMNETSSRQLIDLKKRLSREHINMDFVFSSPSRRCIQTADMIFTNKQILLHDELLEHDPIEQKSNKRMSKQELMEFIKTGLFNYNNNNFILDFVSKDYYFGDENDRLFKNRILNFFKSIIFLLKKLNLDESRDRNINICIVSHHNWIKKFYQLLNVRIGNIGNAQMLMYTLSDDEINMLMNDSDFVNKLITKYNVKNPEKIHRIIDGIKSMRRLLTIDEIHRLIEYFYNNINCNYTIILYIIKEIANIDPSIDLSYYMNSNEGIYSDSGRYQRNGSAIMFIYYRLLNQYSSNGYLIFSLGDSLDKFNTFWNLMNIDNQIIKIPFSGNMFSNKFEIIQPDFDNIIRLFNTMLENNSSFRLLIDRLNLNEDNILITDYMAEGKALFTLFELFGHFGINVSKLTLHFITYTENIVEIITPEIANFNRKYPSLNIVINQPDHVGLNINITYTEVLDYYFSNADKFSNSRCMPRYPYTSWENVPNDVYRKGTEDNYYLCNIHTLIFYLFHRCYYTQFILKKMYDPDPDLNDRIKLEHIIKGFFNTYLNYNNDEGLRRKYLKYKLKYLKLKENK